MSTATQTTPDSDVRTHALAARAAARQLAATSGEVRDAGLEAIAVALESEREAILAANAEDLVSAQQMAVRGKLGEPLGARLNLATGKYDRAIEMVRSVKSADDPLWQTQRATEIASAAARTSMHNPSPASRSPAR